MNIKFTFTHSWEDVSGIECDTQVTAVYSFDPPNYNVDSPTCGPGGESMEILSAPGLQLDQYTIEVLTEAAFENIPEPEYPED